MDCLQLDGINAVQEGANKILAISLAPYFCSLTNNAADSYLMVPTGLGGLVYPKEVSQYGLLYSMDVYRADLAMAVWDNVSVNEAD